jgi:hypothetical protein
MVLVFNIQLTFRQWHAIRVVYVMILNNLKLLDPGRQTVDWGADKAQHRQIKLLAKVRYHRGLCIISFSPVRVLSNEGDIVFRVIIYEGPRLGNNRGCLKNSPSRAHGSASVIRKTAEIGWV